MTDFKLEDLMNEQQQDNSFVKEYNQKHNESDLTLNNKVQNLQQELELANKTNEDLQLIIKRIKEEKNFKIDDISKTKEIELNQTKQTLENKSKHQITVIERLIKEKKVLLMKCEEFNNRLKQAEAQNSRNITEAEMRFAQELKKQRETWAEVEKQRRDEFIAKKTKEIKEMTIKGLEPELQRMMRKNQDELRLKENEFSNLLESEKLKLIQGFDDKLNIQKKDLLNMKENEIIKERESLSIKLKENWDL